MRHNGAVREAVEPRYSPRPRKVRIHFAGKKGHLWGGPYSEVERFTGRTGARWLRIKLAKESTLPADITVPTADFGLPPEAEFRAAVEQAARALIRGDSVYVGCGYGWGRTGTFLAALVKLERQLAYLRRVNDLPRASAVRDVREVYTPEAVETEAQALFVEQFDTRGLARRIAFRLNPLVVFDKRFWTL